MGGTFVEDGERGMMLYWDQWATELGKVVALVDDRERLCRLEFVSAGQGGVRARVHSWANDDPCEPNAKRLNAVRKQVDEYMCGRRQRFELRLSTMGTEFQERVWSTLKKARFGQVWTYPQLAARAGHEGAVRAAGLANARNPISLVIPCHRIVSVDGSLRGYGGGLERKVALLEFESRLARGEEADLARLFAQAKRLLKVEGTLKEDSLRE